MILGTSKILVGSSKFILNQPFLSNQKEFIIKTLNDPYLNNLNRIPDITLNYLSSVLRKKEKLFINIKQTEFDKLKNARSKASKINFNKIPEDFAKAKISKDGETIRAKIRLKGDQ